MNGISFGQADIVTTKTDTQKTNPTKTHAGLYTGIVTGTVGSLLAKSVDSFVKATGIAKPQPWLVAVPIISNVAIGALIDNIRNKRMAKFSEETAGLNSFKAVEKDENAELTPKGNPYLKMATGKKYGTLLFAITAPILGSIRMKTLLGLVAFSMLAIKGAITGLVFGAIADYFSNKTARKSADANPYPKTDEPSKK